MPNRNYQRGVRFEREVMKDWKETMGAEYVARAAGSHSPFDVIVICKGHPTFIQCKVIKKGNAFTMTKAFRENPPLTPSPHFHQMLIVKTLNEGTVRTTV